MYGIHICSFASALDDIPAKKRKDMQYVLSVLDKNPRFSCFAASEWPALAKTLDALKDRGYMEYLPDSPTNAYPWCEVRLTDKGRALLAA